MPADTDATELAETTLGELSAQYLELRARIVVLEQDRKSTADLRAAYYEAIRKMREVRSELAIVRKILLDNTKEDLRNPLITTLGSFEAPSSDRGSVVSTILVVDDDEDIRDCLKDTLEAQGYVVQLAADGQEALDMLRAGPLPSLVLFDIMMPVVDGVTLFRECAKDPILSKIPAIVISAQATPNELPVARLAKPINLDALFGTIERLINK